MCAPSNCDEIVSLVAKILVATIVIVLVLVTIAV